MGTRKVVKVMEFDPVDDAGEALLEMADEAEDKNCTMRIEFLEREA